MNATARVTTTAATAVLLASGCAMLNRTPAELRSGQTEVTRVCTQLEIGEAAERVRQGWRGCHFTGPTPSTSQAVVVGTVPILVATGDYEGDYIRVDQTGARLTVVKGANSSKLGTTVQLIADVEKTPHCTAEVVARGSGPVWNSRARAVAHYLANPDKGCEP
jgi:hypothetical protein